VDTVVFDKTGTLTLPEPRVDNAPEIPADLLELAARLALSSRHPLAAAVAREARERVPFESAVEEPGRGVRAMIDGREARLGSPAYCGIPDPCSQWPAGKAHSSLLAFRHGERRTVLAVRQALRQDAKDAIRTLIDLGLDVHILSGDRSPAVAPIAATLGVDRWQAGLKPADKIAALEAMKTQGRRVLMVGDGLNDAPALAAAHASLSPISAVDLTQAQADAVFLGERLLPVADAVIAARRAHRLMRQNLAFAAIYNAVAVPIAILGLVTPLIAAVAMSGSSLLVTLNALRARLRPSMQARP
jgi:Cu2+-exporting ATPase